MEKNPYNEEEFEKFDEYSKLTPSERKLKDQEELAKDKAKMDTLADDEEGGRKIVEDEVDEEKKQREEKSFLAKELAQKEKEKGWWMNYAVNICNYGEHLLRKIDWPEGWAVVITPTDGSSITIWGRTYQTKQGVIIFLRSPKGIVFQRGILTSMDADIDIHAVETLVVQVENTIDSIRGLLESDKKQQSQPKGKGGKISKSGIYLGK